MMWDKIAVQKSAAMRYLPHTQQPICFFHTKEIFKKEIFKIDIGTKKEKKMY